MNSVLYILVSNIAILSCLVPFFMLLSRKMRQVAAYRLLGVYWLLNALIHFTDVYFFLSLRNTRVDQFLNYYNVLDTPLVLLIFACANSGRHRRTLLMSIFLFIAAEIAIIGWKGYDAVSGFIFTGFGVFVVVFYSIIGLVQYMRKMEYTSFENSMVFIYGALLFAYGSFLIISMFLHIRGDTEGNSRDSYLLYYFSLLISAVITSLGLWSYGLRRHPRMAADHPH
ncbi:MAG TPA: hypothetical protein VGM31_12095 [Puia sp.]